jgi:hypothetical protein
MKVLLLVMSLLPSLALAYNTQVKGFLALDLLKIQKIDTYPKDHLSYTAGIGTFDLKFNAEQDRLSLRIKLDLDDKSLTYVGNIFEEVTANYRLNDMWNFTAGKGVVPFHQKHWGVLQNCYVDGGTVLEAYPKWNDQDEKYLGIINYGSYNRGFINSFTFYGDSKDVDREADGSESLSNVAGKGDVKRGYKNQLSFDAQYQHGFANQFEVYPIKGLTLAVAGIHYWNAVNPKASWAVDANGKFKNDRGEIWAEYVYGYYSSDYWTSYSVLYDHEMVGQVGGELYLTDTWSALANLEYQWSNRQEYNYIDSKDKNYRRGQKVEMNAYKADVGMKAKIDNSAYITLGAIAERKTEKQSDRPKRDAVNAYVVGSTFSWWF